MIRQNRLFWLAQSFLSRENNTNEHWCPRVVVDGHWKGALVLLTIISVTCQFWQDNGIALFSFQHQKECLGLWVLTCDSCICGCQAVTGHGCRAVRNRINDAMFQELIWMMADSSAHHISWCWYYMHISMLQRGSNHWVTWSSGQSHSKLNRERGYKSHDLSIARAVLYRHLVTPWWTKSWGGLQSEHYSIRNPFLVYDKKLTTFSFLNNYTSR